MKYTGLNPTDVNRVSSGSLGVFVESTQVGTFGIDSLVVTGSTTFSGSLKTVGTSTVTGSTTLSGSLAVIGPQTLNGNFTVTGSSILSSSLSVIGTETVNGTLVVTGSFIPSGSISSIGSIRSNGNLTVTGSTTLSGSLTNIGSQTQSGSLTVIGNTVITGSTTLSSSLNVIGTETVTGLLNTIGTLLVTGSTILSSSLSVVGTSTVSGSSLVTGSLQVTGPTSLNGNLSVTGSEYISGSTDVLTAQGSTAGGTLLNILGTSGQLFTVTDGLSGSLFSVNTISGLPVLEAFSDFSFVAGTYGVNNLFVSGSKVGILTNTPSATLDVIGNTRITGSTVITGSVSIPAVGDSSLLTVGSAGSPYLLVTGSTGRVSVNTTSSVSSLNVGGTTNVLTVQGTTTEGNMFDVYGPSGQLFSVVDGLTGSLFSVNTISGVPVMEAFSDNTIRLGQYSNPPIVISGSTATVSGSLVLNSSNLNINTGSLSIFRSGSASPSDALFDVEGAQGQLFSVIDTFSGSLMSVNDISGFPILDVRSDDSVIMGTFGSNALVVSGSSVIIGVTASAAPTVTGSNGQIQFAVVGGNAFIYAWLGGRWRSGSLA
jgi:mucin-19